MSEIRERTISRVTVWGALANLALTGIKFAAGALGHSSAMLADAVHSFSDLVSDIVVLVMVRVSSKGKDKGHDYGHGKFETLATAIVALLLLVVGARLMAGGIEKIRLVISGGELEIPGGIALAAALVSILVKEILYQWTSRSGKRVNSQAMVANAWHHRSDALSSVGSAIGIGCAMLFGGRWAVLDPAVCCIISIVILVVAVRMALPAMGELTEASLPDEMEARITGIIESVSGVEGIHDLRTRRNGPDIMIEAHMVVDPDMRVADAHRLADNAEDALRREFGEGTHISLHMEPSGVSDD